MCEISPRPCSRRNGIRKACYNYQTGESHWYAFQLDPQRQLTCPDCFGHPLLIHVSDKTSWLQHTRFSAWISSLAGGHDRHRILQIFRRHPVLRRRQCYVKSRELSVYQASVQEEEVVVRPTSAHTKHITICQSHSQPYPAKVSLPGGNVLLDHHLPVLPHDQGCQQGCL